MRIRPGQLKRGAPASLFPGLHFATSGDLLTVGKGAKGGVTFTVPDGFHLGAEQVAEVAKEVGMQDIQVLGPLGMVTGSASAEELREFNHKLPGIYIARSGEMRAL